MCHPLPFLINNLAYHTVFKHIHGQYVFLTEKTEGLNMLESPPAADRMVAPLYAVTM